MKVLAVFAAILAVAFGAGPHWTLNELSEALQSPYTNPSLVPILEQALNSYMDALYAGQQHEYINIQTAPVDLSTWTLQDLSAALESPNTSPAILPYLENALNTLTHAIVTGEVQAVTAQVSIVIPSLEVSYWTLADLEQALSSPATSPAMIPYLEQAINHIMEQLISGVQQTSIVLAIPVEAAKPVPATPEVVVDEAPEAPAAPEVVTNPITPTPVVSGSPLVQIILNINQQAVTPEAVITPAPVSVPDNTESFPNPRPPPPVNPRPPVPAIVEPVIVVPEPSLPSPVVEPEPVIVAPDFNPIDVIAVNPEPVNPIEVVAVSPPEVNPIEVIAVSPPEINPVDLINPVVVPAVVAGGDIGPM